MTNWAVYLIAMLALSAGLARADTFDDAEAAYRNGKYAQAAQSYRASAAQGNVHAEYILGLMYEEGQGVGQDFQEALKWYRRGAAHGDAMAQFGLGAMYGKGRGVAQDYREAAMWFRKAAVQGYATAQGVLSVMYGMGQGVPQDFVQAMTWCIIADANGNNGGGVLQKLESNADQAQIAEAQTRAREWLAAHPRRNN